MKYIKWNKNTFWRKYNDIGICFQQTINKTIVVNKQATCFLQFLSREWQDITSIINKVSSIFPDIAKEEIERDFLQLLASLHKLNIVAYDSDKNNLKETPTKLTDINLDIKNLQHSKVFLDSYFKNNPQLMSLQIEITPNCNLKCVHCYLGFGYTNEHSIKPIPTNKICQVINEFAKLGGLHISFTGGEALLNKDLISILECAYKNDLSITLLTNGTLFDEQFVKLLSKYNLAKVQLSLYSMTNKDHDAITQMTGSCDKTKNTINLLKKYHIPVQLACLGMKENKKSFSSVIDFSKNNGFAMKVGHTIQALETFEQINLKHRLNLKETESFIRKYFSKNPDAALRLVSATTTVGNDDVLCGLGHYALNLNAQGKYTPCAGFDLELGDVNKNSLYDVFYNSPYMKKFRNIRLKDYEKCYVCEDRNYCDLCPGKLYAESGGDMFKLSDYFCEVAHLTKKIAEDFVKEHKKLN